MRSDLVVLPEPNIDSDLGLPCGVKPFGVEHFFVSAPACVANVISSAMIMARMGLKVIIIIYDRP